MPLINLPSVQVDNVVEDVLNATQAVCTGDELGPFDLGSGGNFTIAVDGGSAQTIAFAEAQFADLSAATIAEVVASINTQLTGAVAVAESTGISITSDLYGTTSELIISNGTLAIVVMFGFGAGSSVTVNGTDADDTVVLINRNPEPNQIGIPSDSLIYFEIASTDGTAPDYADLVVTIGGVIAWDGADFVNGFLGTHSNPAADVLAFEFEPPNEFTTTEIVSVQVALSSPTFSETYSFTAEDTEAPQIASVQGRDGNTLRVTFNEPVTMESASGAADALNISNYTIERLSKPAVSVEVTAVSQYSDRIVDLTTDIELTFGALYMLIVANVEDLEGNAFVAPNNISNFYAYSPPFPNGRRFRLWDFIPGINKSEDANKELELFISIFQEIVNLLLVSVDQWTEILDLDTAPEDFLDAMLADLGNPFDDFDLSEIDKRRLLRVLVGIYKLKGTAAGIIDVIRFFLGIDVEINVFNDYTGWVLTSTDDTTGAGTELGAPLVDAATPSILGPSQAGIYSFSIHSPTTILTTEERERITAIVELMKPAHTHLVMITDPTPETPTDHVELGISVLGTTTAGGSAGTFILHEP